MDRLEGLISYANVLNNFLTEACNAETMGKAEQKFLAVCDELDKELNINQEVPVATN